MSQQHAGKGRRLGRRTASLVSSALAGGLFLACASPVQAAPQEKASSRDAQKTTYLVQLADRPVATDPDTAPARGERLDTRTEAVRDHVRDLKRERDKVLDAVPGVRPQYTYTYVLNGFSAELTSRQADTIARTPGVVSLTRNVASHPAATSASTATAGALTPPDVARFLGLKDRKGLYSKMPGGQAEAGQKMILGVIDTGIDTGNPSLAALPEPRLDAEVIAKKWKGSCDRGADPAHLVTCNNKVIGAQYFNKGVTEPSDTDWASPMDSSSHGTHTATTAAGDFDVPVSVPDTGIAGRTSGLAPAARIAAYKVCWSSGCWTVDIVAALDKAVADGVDVINLSLGGSNSEPANRPEYMAEFNAAKAGVFISAAVGNTGPGTASNGVPWLTTVGASSHDVGYRATVTLGNGTSYTGVGGSESALPSAPLTDAANAAKAGVDSGKAAMCMPGTLEPDAVKGAIVVCARGGAPRPAKSAEVKAAGGVGMVLYNTNSTDEQSVDSHTVPSLLLDKADGEATKAYADEAGATARLTAARSGHQEAPQIPGFSSGGPDLNSNGDLLKPDIAAPGVDIVAGTTPGGDGGTYTGQQGILSGTSMAAPHISGLGLLLRQLHPDWSPMEVKSALMTTATTRTNEGRPIRRSGGITATPLDYGAGQVAPNTADDPGLVYDSTSDDWTAYLCAIGQPPVTGDGGDACATARRTDPSDLNTPTISVGDLARQQTVTRTVTNVADETGVYTVTLQTPPGYKAAVSPRALIVPPGASATYRITFTRTDAAPGDWRFGSVGWSDKHHNVLSAVALRAAQGEAGRP
ncbi:S8 family serine peptidase [Streptomyces sp. SID13726]|uniref:S8 family serine peptidase n=1 Tax=Streptomyces sp. SID13726 TaxID=2706058 RepID=UPI001941F519|nr:S8 family serine peptidase [Streptomyces sp. SID13726]